MKIYFPGQKVPSEIEKVEMLGYQGGDPHLRFSSPCIVKRTEKGYFVRPIVLMGCVMTLRASCDHVFIQGSPGIEDGETHINCKPIIPSWCIIGALALLILCTNLGIEL